MGSWCPKCNPNETHSRDDSVALCSKHQDKARIAELEAARRAYASEFPLKDGQPDVGSIHANIRILKAGVLLLCATETALRGIIEIGKRDMSNPKYDGYFTEASEALAAIRATRGNE